MNDGEVRKQLQQMINFIKQEAREKAEEIKVKAEEEFSIERANIVMEERKKINKDFERKLKQVEVRKKIARSNELNQARLRVLKARESSLEKILDDATKRLRDVARQSNYKTLLKDLIVQGLIQLREQEVTVVARECDNELVQSILAEAKKEYDSKTNSDIVLSLHKKHRLAPPPVEGSDLPACCGGVLLSANNGKILCNNTLEQRLTLSYEQLLPQIRTTLFGESLTRRYKD